MIKAVAVLAMMALAGPVLAKPISSGPAPHGNPVISCDWINPGGHSVRPPGLCGNAPTEEPPIVDINDEVFVPEVAVDDVYVPAVNDDEEIVPPGMDFDERIAVDSTNIPEPSTLALLLAGGVSVAVRKWGRR